MKLVSVHSSDYSNEKVCFDETCDISLVWIRECLKINKNLIQVLPDSEG